MVKDCTSNRGLIPKIYKELKKLDTNKPNDPTEKWGTELNRKDHCEEVRGGENWGKELRLGLGHLWDELETQNKENTQELMRVTLVRFLAIGDTKWPPPVTRQAFQ